MALAAIVSVRWGAFAIGGSDSHCYAGQARMFVEGRLSLAPPITLPVPWPNAAATFAPSGFAQGPDPSGGSVPLCAAVVYLGNRLDSLSPTDPGLLVAVGAFLLLLVGGRVLTQRVRRREPA